MSLTRDAILEHLEAEAGADPRGIEDTTLLFSSGLVDSFAMVSLIIFIESSSGIKIKPTDVTLDNLDSVERILQFVERRGGDGSVEA